MINIFNMPQFRPLRWLNLLTWSFALISLATVYHQTINFPSIIRMQLSRLSILFIK